MRLFLITSALAVVSLSVAAEGISKEERNSLETFCWHHGKTAALYVDARNLGAPKSFASGGGNLEAMTSQDFVYRFNRLTADFVWGKQRPDKKWAGTWAITECLWQIDNPSSQKPR